MQLHDCAGNERPLVARVPGTVTILIPDGCYFLQAAAKMNGIYVQGIDFVGGKGAFLFTNTSNNVAFSQNFIDCNFIDYTECAIANNADDHPYLRVLNCGFMGAAGCNTIGAAWGGYVDRGTFAHNMCLQNAYHLKLGPRLSGSFLVTENDFVSFGETATIADCWVVPNNVDNYGSNSGHGVTFTRNKYGNENASATRHCFMIANEDTSTGTGRQNRQPYTGPSDYGYLTQIEITGNTFFGTSNTTTGCLVISYIGAGLRGINWHDNVYDGSSYAYVVNFANPPVGDYTNTTSTFTFKPNEALFGSQPAKAFSNVRFAMLMDYGSYWPGDPNAVEVYPVCDDASVALVLNGFEHAGALVAFGAATTVKTADPNGLLSMLAVTATAGGAGAGVANGFGSASLASGADLWIDLLLGRALALTCTHVIVDVFCYATLTTAFRQIVTLPVSGFGRFLRQVHLPPSSAPGAWQLRVYAADWVAGSATGFRVGWPIVNSGRGRAGYARADAARTALPRNRHMIGAAVGTMPMGWTIGSNGVTGATLTVVKAGSDATGNFIDVAGAGTATHAGNKSFYVYFGAPGNDECSTVAKVNYKFPLALKAGSLATLTPRAAEQDGTSGYVDVGAIIYTGAVPPVYIAERNVACTPVAAVATYGGSAIDFTNQSAASILPIVNLGVPGGATINFILRIYVPKLVMLS